MKNYWTHKECDIIIKQWAKKTSWFGDNEVLGRAFTFEEMYELLRYRMNFGIAETYTIIACLIKAGAKITK